MNSETRSSKFPVRILLAMAILLTFLGFLKSIFISLDIDEAYAVAQAYRFVQGDRLLAEMWEPHQFSLFGAAPFIRLFLTVTGSVEYLVIFLRIVGILLHILVGVVFYRALCRTPLQKPVSIALFLIHLNFLPKWVQMPEFELIHYWCLILMAACLIFYLYGKKNPVYPFLAGLFLVLSACSYPTMVLLYPAYLAAWILPERQQEGKRSFRAALLFTGGCALGGGALLAYLFSYQSVPDLMENLSNIFLDQSHTYYTQSEKWTMYLGQILDQLKTYLVDLAIGAAVTFVSYTLQKKRTGQAEKRSDLILTAFLLAAGVMFLQFLLGAIFGDRNLFFLQSRYVAISLPALVIGIRRRKELGIWLYGLLIPAYLSLFAVLLVTNMDTNTSYAKLFAGVLGSIILYSLCLKERNRERSGSLSLGLGVSVSFLFLGLFVSRLLLIRVTGCLPLTVNARLEKMEYGAEKGIYVLEDRARIWNENYPLLQEILEPGDRLLYIGAENLIYLTEECEVASPSTQGTNVYNEMFLKYFGSHPEKLPDLIVIDKTFFTNDSYGNYFGADEVLNWIAENYGDRKIIETNHLTIVSEE